MLTLAWVFFSHAAMLSVVKQLLTNKQPRGWCVSGAVPLSSTRCCWRLFTIRSSSTSWRNNVWIKTNMRQKSVKNKTGKKFKKLFQIGGCLRNTHTHTHTHGQWCSCSSFRMEGNITSGASRPQIKSRWSQCSMCWWKTRLVTCRQTDRQTGEGETDRQTSPCETLSLKYYRRFLYFISIGYIFEVSHQWKWWRKLSLFHLH